MNHTQIKTPGRVENAVILCAGMSTRFAPFSYEKPKGLCVVKGEVMLERQIHQLQEAGISEVILVVGYLKEQFRYLEKKCGVTLIENDDYYRYNNVSSVLAAAEHIRSTYICSSDNYFPENPFQPYEDRAWYSGVCVDEDTPEYCMYTDESDRIVRVEWESIRGKWSMRGPAYFSADFSRHFLPRLREAFAEDVEVQSHFWEYYLAENIAEFPIWLKKYDASLILEFDSIDELRLFDSWYSEHAGSESIENICEALNCLPKDVTDFVPVPEGDVYRAFRFRCGGREYLYRLPEKGECFSLQQIHE